MATEQRKLVSVVFADVVGSTAFGSDNDPEAVRAVMGSYFERMKAIAETHGGTVEKFIGDAVMVVFGVPRLHDDDAERAVRAALAMCRAMDDLNRELRVQLAARVGVNTGEAVAGGSDDRQFLVTGDAVNIAARLQQGADPGEVIVGPLTESLTRSAIEYAAHAPVSAKGKPEPITAHRAVRARSVVPEQARGLPAMRAQLVGRQRELRLLLETFERVRDERRAHVFTLVGNAGIGKSRLVGEALARIAGAGSARVLRGRCLPYGAGITYWPLMEIVREDAAIASDDSRDTALAKLDRRVGALLVVDAPAVSVRLAVMLGLRRAEEALPEVPGERVASEIAWGVRQYVAALAREPAVIVVDDLQWAEPPVLEIVERIADTVEDAPLLLLCVARPQLLEANASWGAGRSNAATITLDALTRDETATLIGRLLDVDDLPDDLRERVVRRSEGNPLFCEEFLRMLIDEGRVERVGERWRATASAAEVRVPESIHALLAARLDALGEDERRVLQVAAIVGERFGAAELRDLEPGIDISKALGLLRRAGLAVEDHDAREPERYRFKHLLMRDVAYTVMPKAARADVHERFGAALDRAVGDRREEFAEILAHHAACALTLSIEVRAPRESVEPRARRALDWALALGERARQRQDFGLLSSSAATATAALPSLPDGGLPADRLRVMLLAANERRLAASYVDALAMFESAAALAVEPRDPSLGAQAHLGAAAVLVFISEEAQFDSLIRHLAQAKELFREIGDTGGEIEAGLLGLEAHWGSGRLSDLVAEGERLLGRAREIGDAARELQICSRLVPAAGLLGRMELLGAYQQATNELVARLGTRVPPWSRISGCGSFRARGDLAGAVACYEEMHRISISEGDQLLEINSFRSRGEMLLELHDYSSAEPHLLTALEISIRTGERWSRTELTAGLAVAAAGTGDFARADRLLLEAHGLERPSDVYAVATVLECEAEVRELEGRTADADVGYRGSLDIFSRTEFHSHHGIARLTYTEFLSRNGRAGEAAEQLAAAEALLGAQTGARAERIAALRASMGARRA